MDSTISLYRDCSWHLISTTLRSVAAEWHVARAGLAELSHLSPGTSHTIYSILAHLRYRLIAISFSHRIVPYSYVARRLSARRARHDEAVTRKDPYPLHLASPAIPVFGPMSALPELRCAIPRTLHTGDVDFELCQTNCAVSDVSVGRGGEDDGTVTRCY